MKIRPCFNLAEKDDMILHQILHLSFWGSFWAGHTRLRFPELSSREKKIRSKKRSAHPPIRARISDETGPKIQLKKQTFKIIFETFQFMKIAINIWMLMTIFSRADFFNPKEHKSSLILAFKNYIILCVV